MPSRGRKFEQIRAVLAEYDADNSLTAREILALLDDEADVESAHEVATVLGHHARNGEVTVIQSSPYQYRLNRAVPTQ